ncbi:hypothetical protein C8J57DRAFT_1250393 [Mycena rebaudengoi]|nr:hypothetical protein C8J57DRAFT_1250393 [Mycena rebaudengoi]
MPCKGKEGKPCKCETFTKKHADDTSDNPNNLHTSSVSAVLARYNIKSVTDAQARRESMDGYRPSKDASSSSKSKTTKEPSKKTELKTKMIKIGYLELIPYGLSVREFLTQDVTHITGRDLSEAKGTSARAACEYSVRIASRHTIPATVYEDWDGVIVKAEAGDHFPSEPANIDARPNLGGVPAVNLPRMLSLHYPHNLVQCIVFECEQ